MINASMPNLWVYHASLVEKLLGPGNRLVFWLSGCDFHCPGCIDPAQWDQAVGYEIPVDDLAGMIAEATDDIDGVTFSGGEPLRQAEALLALLETLPKKLDKMLFTGYTEDELSVVQKQAYECFDIAVAGRFVQELAGDFLWRGSSNKIIVSPSGKYPSEQISEWMSAPSAGISIKLDGERMFTYGVPKKGALDHILRQLEEKGIRVKEVH